MCIRVCVSVCARVEVRAFFVLHTYGALADYRPPRTAAATTVATHMCRSRVYDENPEGYTRRFYVMHGVHIHKYSVHTQTHICS